MRDGPPQPPPYPAEKARGAEVNLRTPLQRIVFFGALIGAVILVPVLWLLSSLMR